MDARTFRSITSALAIALSAVGSHSAFAQSQIPQIPLSSAVADAIVSNDTSVSESTGGIAYEDNGVSVASAYYAGNEGFLSISINPGSSSLQTARASATWQFEVVGAPGISNIPLVIIGNGRLSSENVSPATYLFEDQATFGGNVPGFALTQSINENTQTIFNVNSFAQVVVNVPYTFSMSLDAYSFGGITGTIKGSVDPNVNFAPGFDSTGLTIVSSPVSPVPEPSTSWLLLSGGFGLLAFRKFRSRPGVAR